MRSSEKTAELFHETYERLAPKHQYETRKASAVPWSDVPDSNKALMIEVAAVVGSEIRKDALTMVLTHVLEQQRYSRSLAQESTQGADLAEDIEDKTVLTAIASRCYRAIGNYQHVVDNVRRLIKAEEDSNEQRD